jgi:hydrogenase nickel incorporation protein HypA/HybF
MHEMSLAESVVKIAEDAAQREGFARVKTVWLEVGVLAAVDPEAMHFCFDAVTRDSIAEGARLEIITVPGSARCSDCARTVPVTARYDPCPECGGHQLQMIGGTEMQVKELEVE